MKKTAFIIAFVALATSVFATAPIQGKRGGKKSTKKTVTKPVTTLAGTEYISIVPANIQRLPLFAAKIHAEKLMSSSVLGSDQIGLIYTYDEQDAPAVLTIQWDMSAGTWKTSLVPDFHDLTKPVTVYTLAVK